MTVRCAVTVYRSLLVPCRSFNRQCRASFAYLTSEVPSIEPRSGATGVLLLHHGEPKTAKEGFDFALNSAISFYAVPTFLKQSLWKWAKKMNLEKRLSNYFRACTNQVSVHQRQSAALESTLDRLVPELGPYRCYVGYVWAQPSINQALEQMKKDSITRAFVLPLYPHYWCFQSGISVNELCKELRKKTCAIENRNPCFRHWGSKEEVADELRRDQRPQSVRWSLIDRWPAHPSLTDAYSQIINQEVELLPYDVRHRVAILFCAPYWRLYNGSEYRRELAASALRISEALQHRFPYRMAWFHSWTQWNLPFSKAMHRYGVASVLRQFVRSGYSNVLVVPLPYVAPSIDTEVVLREVCRSTMLRKVGVNYLRFIGPPSDHPAFVHGMAEVVKNHYLSETKVSSQFALRCRSCVWPSCKRSREIFAT